MNLSSLSTRQLKKKLKNGLGFQIGSFNVCLTSSLSSVCTHLSQLYSKYEILDEGTFFDFYIKLDSPSLVRHYFRPQVIFSFDGHLPFKPLPMSQAGAMFEWGLNWCIANHSNQFLILHAAVVELNGHAIVFPGAPGSGKSTLCAALVCNGWRLLSDEMALVSIETGQIYPVPRPVSLKNQSIDVIRNYSAEAFFGKVVHDTAKGSVAHMRSPEISVVSANRAVMPEKLIFPKYNAQDIATELIPVSKGNSVLRAAEQCFNYSVLGVQGFENLCSLIDKCDCYEFNYNRLDEAISLFTEMVSD